MSSPASVVPFQLALSIAWCRDAPERVGEVAMVNPRTSRAVLGRGGDGEGRLLFGRFWQSHNVTVLRSSRLSRTQMLIRPSDDELIVANVGRCPMIFEDEITDAARIGVGAVVELKNELVLTVTRRPATTESNVQRAFGRADAFGLVGESVVMEALRRHIGRAAAMGGPCLVTGAAGAGKAMVARALHLASGRDEIVSMGAGGILPIPLGATALVDGWERLEGKDQVALLRHPGLISIARGRCNGSPFEHVLPVPGLDRRTEDIPLLLRDELRKLAQSEHPSRRFFPGRDPREAPRVAPRLMRNLMTRSYTGNVGELAMWARATAGSSPGEWLDGSIAKGVPPQR